MTFHTQPLSSDERPLEAEFVISPGGETELRTFRQKLCHKAAAKWHLINMDWAFSKERIWWPTRAKDNKTVSNTHTRCPERFLHTAVQSH